MVLFHLIQRKKAGCREKKVTSFNAVNEKDKKIIMLHAFGVGCSTSIMHEQNFMIPVDAKKQLILLTFITRENAITNKDIFVWQTYEKNCWPRLNLS